MLLVELALTPVNESWPPEIFDVVVVALKFGFETALMPVTSHP